jgi:hypothetical protein
MSSIEPIEPTELKYAFGPSTQYVSYYKGWFLLKDGEISESDILVAYFVYDCIVKQEQDVTVGNYDLLNAEKKISLDSAKCMAKNIVNKFENIYRDYDLKNLQEKLIQLGGDVNDNFIKKYTNNIIDLWNEPTQLTQLINEAIQLIKEMDPSNFYLKLLEQYLTLIETLIETSVELNKLTVGQYSSNSDVKTFITKSIIIFTPFKSFIDSKSKIIENNMKIEFTKKLKKEKELLLNHEKLSSSQYESKIIGNVNYKRDNQLQIQIQDIPILPVDDPEILLRLAALKEQKGGNNLKKNVKRKYTTNKKKYNKKTHKKIHA